MIDWTEPLIVFGIPTLVAILLHFAPGDGTSGNDTYF